MQKLLSTSGVGDETLQRRRAGQPTPERQLIAAHTEGWRAFVTGHTRLIASFSVMRRAPGENAEPEDELLNGVVRTVTAQADSRDQSRRRARQFNRKSRKSMFR